MHKHLEKAPKSFQGVVCSLLNVFWTITAIAVKA